MPHLEEFYRDSKLKYMLEFVSEICKIYVWLTADFQNYMSQPVTKFGITNIETNLLSYTQLNISV